MNNSLELHCSTEIQKAAAEYYERGLCVVPARGKIPTEKWGVADHATQTLPQVLEMFSGDEPPNIAIVCGAPSGGLVVRDFDVAGAYSAWAAAHPELAKSLPTVQTARGYHVYCRDDQLSKTIDFGEGELRVNGIVVAPPSVHESGAVYTWSIPIAREIPTVDVAAAGLATAWHTPDTAVESSNMASTLSTLSTLSTAELLGDEGVRRAILRWQPPGEGLRNKYLFELARQLKAIPLTAPLTALQLTPVVVEWHKYAKKQIATKDLGASLADFAFAWNRVRHPAGADVMGDIVSAARMLPVPPELDLCEPDETIVVLANMLRLLQAQSPNRSIYLSCDKAGALLSIHSKTAWRLLRGLVEIGLLKVVKPGEKRQRKATRYRYRGEMIVINRE